MQRKTQKDKRFIRNVFGKQNELSRQSSVCTYWITPSWGRRDGHVGIEGDQPSGYVFELYDVKDQDVRKRDNHQLMTPVSNCALALLVLQGVPGVLGALERHLRGMCWVSSSGRLSLQQKT